MREYYELVQRGFGILLTSLSGYIGQELNKAYGDQWWAEVLETLSDQRKDLPISGSYGDLVDSLDIANCIRLINRKWNDVFVDCLPRNCRTWANELMGVRNIVSHIGQQDLEQPEAERALDTMALLCKEIDPDGSEEIREIYRDVRAKADSMYRPAPIVFTGLAQPASDSKRGALKEGSLLQLVGGDVVQQTTLTRKVTYGGKTVIYPVYRVRLDALYYNDQNDRIATWISRYESENGADSLSDLSTDTYNRIIEGFICESNLGAIERTQNNISFVGQREPGVTLADGRIVDGNRRFTCLRRIQRTKAEPVYFETVIMDMDIREDRKQIKLLELATQHGEEKKVDYDLIDYAIGTYRDVVQTKLLTVDEYASSTNEKPASVRERIEIAGVICEFLDYLRLSGQYHIAREYQVYSLIKEMMKPLKKQSPDGKKMLKTIAFNNVMMKAIPDQRKFIRDINMLSNSSVWSDYCNEQNGVAQLIQNRFSEIEVNSKEDVDRFADDNPEIKVDLQASMEKALQRYRNQTLKNRPSEYVSKCISLLREVDSRLFGKMDVDEKEALITEFEELSRIVKLFQDKLKR